MVWFFGLGLGLLVMATMSWIGVYQSILFYARGIQTVLLVLVVPLFLAMGRPITLAITALPTAGPKIEAAARSKVAKVLTFPAITTFTLIVVPFVMYFTTWYTHVFTSSTVRELTYLALMIPGFVFFWTLLRVDPVPKEYSYGISMWITAAEVIGDAFLGLAIIADQNLIGGAYYHALARPWGPTLESDQILGGGALWILGDLVGLPFLALQLIQLMREDESEARRVDAELDARETSAVETSGQEIRAKTEEQSEERILVPADNSEPGSPPGEDAQPVGAQASAEAHPWWESDDRFTGRFKPTDADSNAGQ